MSLGRRKTARFRYLLMGTIAMGCVAAVFFSRANRQPTPSEEPSLSVVAPPGETFSDLTDAQRRASELNPRVTVINNADRVMLWWESVPLDVRQRSQPPSLQSNIHRDDYVGPEACRECHQKNYEKWSEHPHRWMNALATNERVKGDFSGQAFIEYLGGKATFFREGEGYRMELKRDSTRLLYAIHQTIGSRFFQYYVGKLIEGPFSPEHVYFQVDHVLPFGYWLDRHEWVPIVHVWPEVPDDERFDPFDPPIDEEDKLNPLDIFYATACNMCHTTFPLAESLCRKPDKVANHAPARLHWHLGGYVQNQHAELWPRSEHASSVPQAQIDGILENLGNLDAREHATTLGISCEACHLGCKEHVETKEIKPEFFPKSPFLTVESTGKPIGTGRSQENINWACGRCHSSPRPEFAAGMSTWNSVEAADAAKGSCYSELNCIDCHDPHSAIGKQWTHTAAEDDAKCLKCHQQFEPAADRQRHTHHAAGSSGARCMNCHMPHLNEGLQNVVRTHMIFSPTNKKMLESQQPNACNLCHTDQTLRWTVTHLNQWYQADLPVEALTAAVAQSDQPAAIGWLQSEKEAVRLVAADALTRNKDTSAFAHLINALDDPYLLNRQFARIGLEQMLDIQLVDFGYRFYMTSDERQAPLQRLRAALLSQNTDKQTQASSAGTPVSSAAARRTAAP